MEGGKQPFFTNSARSIPFLISLSSVMAALLANALCNLGLKYENPSG